MVETMFSDECQSESLNLSAPAEEGESCYQLYMHMDHTHINVYSVIVIYFYHP